MAYTTPPTKSPGDLGQSSDWNTYVRDNLEYLKGAADAIAFKGARWVKSTTQAIPDDSHTLVSFGDSEVYDEGGWGLTASNTTATVPAGAIPSGYTNIVVYVDAFIEFQADADGRRIIQLFKNGASIAESQWYPTVNLSTGMTCSTEVNAVAGDTFSVDVLHQAGNSINVNKGSFVISRRGPYL